METTDNPVPTKQTNKLKIFLGALVGIVIIAVAWYFLYFTKTPEYSLNSVRESIVSHDVNKFKKHVDLDNLLSKSYDDIIASVMDNDPKLANDNFSRNFFEGLARLFKGMFVAEGKDGVMRYVETGKWEKDDGQKQSAPSKNALSVKSVTDKAGVQDASFRGLAYTKKDGDTAIVGAKILLKGSNKEAILDVKMRKLSDGSWQVVEISNLKDFLKEVEEAKQAQQVTK